jgi:hypothetical protein
MHWHGIRQANSCNMDGTNGITEVSTGIFLKDLTG